MYIIIYKNSSESLKTIFLTLRNSSYTTTFQFIPKCISSDWLHIFSMFTCPDMQQSITSANLFCLIYHPASQEGFANALLVDLVEPLDTLELATLAVSFTDRLASLDVRERCDLLEVLLPALLGRLLDAFLGYFFWAECSFIKKSLLRLLVGLTACSLLKICWQKKKKKKKKKRSQS